MMKSVAKVGELVWNDRRLPICEMAEQAGISHGSF